MMKNKGLFRMCKCTTETRTMLMVGKLGICAFLFPRLYRLIHGTMTTVAINHFLSTSPNEKAKAVLDEFVSRVFLGDYGPVADAMYSANLWSGGLSIGIVVGIFMLLCTLEKKLSRRK